MGDGQADFVGVGRGQLADPDFVKRAKEGTTSELMRYIGCEQGKHVTIVEMAGAVARDVAAYTQQHTRWMLQDYGVDIRVNTRVLSVGPDSITVSFDGRTHEIEAKAVVCALGPRPNNEVVDLVKGTGIPFGVIGDAKRPSKIINAVREANALARSI